MSFKLQSPSVSNASRRLSDFLAQQRKSYLNAVKEGKGREWAVVMGNEAGDLDSVASAIAYAWYATTVQKSPTVAITQTPRSDLHLRAENLHAFSLVGVDTSDIICVDDVSPTTTNFPSTRFVLVDHNRLNSRFSQDSNAQVQAVIDHHEDEGLYKDTADPRIVVTPVGSCASMVARYLEGECPDQVPPELATFLLCSIIIDTGGLAPGGKAEETDRLAAAFLAARSTLSSSPDPSITSSAETMPALHDSPAIQELNDTLQTKKRALSHLGTRDLIRRDYKEYALTPSWQPAREILVGIASVPERLVSWLPRDALHFWTHAEAWMAERGLSALGILTSFRDPHKLGKSGHGKHRREQLFVVRTDDGGQLAERLFAGLEDSAELELKKQKFRDVGIEKEQHSGLKARVWKQRNTDATRKVTAPLIKHIVEGTWNKDSQ
ncbi:hypothetical protein AcV5_009494 [Taiwanofungus camphoratus]|nr:hypothetical protein AcV5_009494 [Antrodia cinnamomea]